MNSPSAHRSHGPRTIADPVAASAEARRPANACPTLALLLDEDLVV